MGLETPGDHSEISPVTPRSILIAGEIDVCIGTQDCDEWGTGICEKVVVLKAYSEENK